MYLGMITLTMGLLPLVSIGIEYALTPRGNLVLLIGKWFVFWAVGVRLMLAGLHQIFNPTFTSEAIFKIKDPDARKIVMELSFGNVAIAMIALISVYRTEWIIPAAFAGAVFYGLAGLQHVRNDKRTGIENMALASDLFIAALMVFYLLAG